MKHLGGMGDDGVGSCEGGLSGEELVKTARGGNASDDGLDFAFSVPLTAL